ncbi:MAG TPA: methylmalonyl-CoA carboxyltransferase [Aliiroseovarius sp.]|nr:methylmalonyl-CoA carboxyltransferase [Aliiroseovarius sp.]
MTEPDPSAPASYTALSEELAARRARALEMGGAEKLARRRAAGHLNARERLALLFDEGQMREVGQLAASLTPGEEENTPADGKIAAFGHVEGRPAAAVANDLTVKGASSANVNARKIAYMKDQATRAGMPLVFLGESTGSRLPETMGARAMAQMGQDSQQYCRRRETPWASAVLGPCLGSSTWYSVLSDFCVMRKGAFLAVSSPLVTSQAIGEEVDPEALGGWKLHAEVTGLVDAVARSDEEAIGLIRRFLSYLPGHAGEAPPRIADAGAPDQTALADLVPTAPQRVHDMRKVIRHLFDTGSYFPLKDRFGRSAVTALARLKGQSVGVIATNPMFKGGALDPEGCRKATSFMVLCDSFNIPLVFLVDTPGFLVGKEGERKGAPAHIMNMIHALQLVSVPKVAVILRKSYGQAFLNLGGGRNSDAMAIWPTADVSFMGPGVAANIRPDLAEMEFDTSPWTFAGAFGAHEVLAPAETRDWIAEMLDFLTRRPGGGVGRHDMAAWPTTV